MGNFNQYAEGGAEDFPLPPQLFAGDTPAVVTSDELMTSAAAWPQYTPLQRDASTKAWELWEAGNELAGITAYDIPIATNKRSAVYLAGMFNIDALMWPSGTTEAQAQAACTGTIRCRKLLYSDKRTGNEVLGVPAGPSLLTLLPSSGALPEHVEDTALAAFMSAPNASGAVVYSLHSGTLPAGITINASTGPSGTPTTVGEYTYAVKGIDATGKVGVVHYTHSIVAA